MNRQDTPLWKWILLLIAGFIFFMLLYGIASIPTAFQTPVWVFALLCVLATAAVLAVYGMWWKWTEKRPANDIPLPKLLPDTGIGFGIGILYFVVVTGSIALLGGYRIGSVEWDWTMLTRTLFHFLVVAVGEEVLFRGIVFRMMDDRWGTVVALIVSSLIFGFVHITNDNATVWSSFAIAVEAGLLLGAAYKWSGNLWVPIGIHWAWNYFQGPIFGFAVSGNDTSSLIKPVIEGSKWLTGGEFGAEASIPAVITGIAVSIVFLWLYRRRTCTSR